MTRARELARQGVAPMVLLSHKDVPARDYASLMRYLRAHPGGKAADRGKLAALIAEPCPANMGLVPPRPGFLSELRESCTSAGLNQRR